MQKIPSISRVVAIGYLMNGAESPPPTATLRTPARPSARRCRGTILTFTWSSRRYWPPVTTLSPAAIPFETTAFLSSDSDTEIGLTATLLSDPTTKA